MLRMQSETGWWLISHPDHAHLAGAFAAAWGNEKFRKPEPRDRVLYGIRSHDDGWALRDAHPMITRQGKPSAFSTELVGKYSAFEEIDLADYLAVRDRAVRLVAERDAYAGLLIALHTYNLLTVHADRSTIASSQLPILDSFLEAQLAYQLTLKKRIDQDQQLSSSEKDAGMIEEHFRLLQACDNLSLLTCVAYASSADLLHALATIDGQASTIQVRPMGVRQFQLSPWPFEGPALEFEFPAKHIEGFTFQSSAALQTEYAKTTPVMLKVTLVR